MRKRKRRVAKLTAEARRVRDRIEQWRRTRAKRTAMPAELWTDAVALARGEGAYRTARALRVDFESLKRRIAESSAGEGGAAAPASAFVELTGAQLLAAPTTGATVELSDDAGTRMTVRLATGIEVDVARWIAAFRRRDGA
jgi:hypothetical protein